MCVYIDTFWAVPYGLAAGGAPDSGFIASSALAAAAGAAAAGTAATAAV